MCETDIFNTVRARENRKSVWWTVQHSRGCQESRHTQEYTRRRCRFSIFSCLWSVQRLRWAAPSKKKRKLLHVQWVLQCMGFPWTRLRQATMCGGLIIRLTAMASHWRIALKVSSAMCSRAVALMPGPTRLTPERILQSPSHLFDFTIQRNHFISSTLEYLARTEAERCAQVWLRLQLALCDLSRLFFDRLMDHASVGLYGNMTVSHATQHADMLLFIDSLWMTDLSWNKIELIPMHFHLQLLFPACRMSWGP